MNSIALAAISAGTAALLAAVLLFAAQAKFRSPQATLESFEAFRLPPVLRHRWLAMALPVGETLLALALLLAPGWWFTAALVTSTAVFACFWWMVSAAVARKEQASCNCFGKSVSKMSVHTIRRNQALTAGSGLALVTSVTGSGALPWSHGWLSALAVVALAAIVWFGVRATTSDTYESAGNKVDVVRHAGELGLRTLEGSLFPLARTARSGAILLVFVQASHAESQLAMESALAWRSTDPAARPVHFVVNENEIARNVPPTLEPRDVLLDSARTNTRLIGLEQYPAAILIGHDAKFAIEPVVGAEKIRALLADLDQVWPRSAPTRA
ncbi:MauE/DoxX family redox-associated membrane protein [Zhihengliuella halotolerans]|nr:MauE/DoxX family redox-associated membrane protein [Zhihengliuella halotolerans]